MSAVTPKLSLSGDVVKSTTVTVDCAAEVESGLAVVDTATVAVAGLSAVD